MIHPTASSLLHCIEGNLTSKVEPHVTDTMALSTLATVKHLLRHVAIRIAEEGQALTDDIAELRALLPRIAAWGAGRPVADEIGEALSRPYREPGRYPDVVSLAGEAGALRRALESGLDALQTARAGQGGDPAYLALREDVRSYIKAQIARELAMTEPAFMGQGPRR